MLKKRKYDQRLCSLAYEHIIIVSVHITIKRQLNLKMGTDISPEKINKWPKNTRKDAQTLSSREIQIETTIRYNFTPTRMARLKMSDNNKFGQGCGESKSSHVTGNAKWLSYFENSLAVSPRVKLQF